MLDLGEAMLQRLLFSFDLFFMSPAEGLITYVEPKSIETISSVLL